MNAAQNKSPQHRSRSLLVAGLLALGAGLAVQAQNLLKPGDGLIGAPPPVENEVPKPKQENVTQLPQVEVDGQHDPLSEADKRLGRQKKRLPGLGTDEERRKDRLDKLNEWYQGLAKTPNELNPDAQHQLEKVFDDGVHRDNPGVPSATQRLNPADYRDPIAVQEKPAAKQ